MRVHLGDFVCTYCGRQLSKKSHLNRHMKNVHGVSTSVETSNSSDNNPTVTTNSNSNHNHNSLSTIPTLTIMPIPTPFMPETTEEIIL